MSKILRSEKGAAMVYTATILAVIFGLVVVNLIGSRKHHSDMSSRIRVAITGYNIMENFGQLIQAAYDQGARGGPCPAGTVLRNLAGRRYCLPDTNGNGAFDGADLCVDNYCVNATIVAKNETGGEEAFMTAHYRASFPEKVAAFVRAFPWDQLNSTANAQRIVHLPPAPAAGATNNSILRVVCPIGVPMCKICGTNVACITLRVCPNALGCATNDQFWFQRYGFRI